jgi:formate hydrogenlyase subunit 3/multisubunit Na+/H+ antiporter MnhD subunit
LEQRYLSPKHEKNEKLILWIGIVCFFLSAAIISYGFNQTNKLRTSWEARENKTRQNIEPTTEKETKLKSMVLDMMGDQKELWLRYVFVKWSNFGMTLFLIGCFLVATYLKSRIYRRIIQKLKNSQQEGPADGLQPPLT